MLHAASILMSAVCHTSIERQLATQPYALTEQESGFFDMKGWLKTMLRSGTCINQQQYDNLVHTQSYI